MMKTHSLTVDNLRYSCAGRTLFEHVGFQLDPGQAIQIVGPNGSGKTSLLRVISGLVEPEAGKIMWAGRLIGTNKPAYSQNLIYLGHKPSMRGMLSPTENLHAAMMLRGDGTGIPVESALEYFDLTEFAHVTCDSLSAGQLRRCALAKLQILPSQLWILDEPFTALDKVAVAKTQSLIESHLKAGGLLVMTSHQATPETNYNMMQLDLTAGQAK